MAVNAAATSPLEESRARVERYLRERLSQGSAQPASVDGVLPHVAVLGLEDALTTTLVSPTDAGTILPVYLYDRSVILGPVSAAKQPEPPCFHCVAVRWQKLRRAVLRDILELGGQVHAIAATPYLTPFALEQIWQLFVQLASPVLDSNATDPHNSSFIYELRLDTLQLHHYPIIGDPTCPSCARPRSDTAEGAAIELVSQPKQDIDEYRIRSVHDYNLPLDTFANPVCGVLGNSAEPTLSSTTTSIVSGYLTVRGGTRLFNFFWSGHADVYDDSAALAVCEGLERYAGLQRGRIDNLVVDSYENLRPDALDPPECGLHSEELYRSESSIFTKYTPDLQLPWVWGYSLRDKRPMLLPEQQVYYRMSDSESYFVQESSNGCASGSCLEEAIFYGMMEVIERDAFLLAWYGKVRLPEIDSTTCRNAATQFMIDRISLCGYDVRLFDNRIDLSVPVVTAVATRRAAGDDGLGALCLASGASFNPEEAIQAALCEIATYVADFPERTRSRLSRVKPMVDDYLKVTELHDHPALFGLPEMAQHVDFLLGESRKQPIDSVYQDWERIRPRNNDLVDDIYYCKDLLVQAGFDVIVVDQTSPEQELFGMHTVRVLAPGMIPIDFGWNKQRALHMPRMFTAFRRAGWRTTDLDPGELNRVPHPFP